MNDQAEHSRRINPQALFETELAADGTQKRVVRIAIHDSMVIPPGETATMDFAGTVVGAPRIYEEEEAWAVKHVASLSAGWLWLCEAAQLDPATTWGALHVDRSRLRGLPNEPSKPGDFDLILGGCGPDGGIAFDVLVLFEFKLRKVRSDGSPQSPSSGRGTTQTRAALELGFDRAVLVHALVGDARPLPEGFAPSWASIVSAEFKRAMTACAGSVRESEGENGAPYGYVLFGIGQVPGVDPAKTGALTFVPARSPQTRPLDATFPARTNRKHLRNALREIAGEDRKGPGLIVIS